MPFAALVSATRRKLVIDKAKQDAASGKGIRLIDENGEVVEEDLDDDELLERDIEQDMENFDPFRIITNGKAVFDA